MNPSRPPPVPGVGRPARPLAAIAGFVGFLREHGWTLGTAEAQDFVRVAEQIGPGPGPGLRPQAALEGAWRALACRSAREWRQWPELFQRYWMPQGLSGSTRVSGQTRPRHDIRHAVQQLQRELDERARAPHGPPRPAPGDTALQAPPADGGAAADDADTAPRAAGGLSRTEALQDRRFSEWLPQDLHELQALAERIARGLRPHPTRRWQAEARGTALDLRRTLRSSLRTGGEPVSPVWRRRRREPPRLFVLVDVSRSMQTHAQLFLRIARAFVGAAHARVFVFHTRLTEVTPLLQRDTAAVQEKINAVTAGFGGGTRIATAVEDFANVHARAQLGRRARVWMLSDGFDADPPEALADALRRLRSRGARISWLHPGDAVPASQALLAASPCIDRFARLNRLSDLQAAARLLA